jgi:lipopolysaccharide transport system ATP-binding protein
VLVVDEVLAVGDAAFQRKCLAKAEMMAENGRTVLFVSHQISAVRRLCSRALLIEAGSVRAEGLTADVLHAYLGGLEKAASEILSERSARTGRGGVRLVRVDIVGENGLPATGESATFVFHTTGPTDRVVCSFTIYDDLGEAVSYCDSSERAQSDTKGPAFSCHFPVLLLRPGRYRLNVALASEDGVMEDHVEACALFDVMNGTVHGRPVTPSRGYGSIAIPHRWTVKG